MAQEMCKIHQDKPVTDSCVHCGRGVCVSCAATLSGKTYCLECIKLIDASSAGKMKELDWEKRNQIGFLQALFKTWINVFFHPKRFFSNMPTKAGIGGPLLFAVIWGALSIICVAFINMMVTLSGGAMSNLQSGVETPSISAMVGTYVTLMILSPVLVIAGIFIGSFIYHLVVLIFGGREGFRATFRVISYTNAIAPFNLIPIAGPVFVTVYSVILFAIGFKRAHKMSTLRASIAAFLPMLILFVIGFIAAFYLASQGALPPFIPTAAPVGAPTQ